MLIRDVKITLALLLPCALIFQSWLVAAFYVGNCLLFGSSIIAMFVVWVWVITGLEDGD